MPLRRQPNSVNRQFQKNGKFALLTFNNVYAKLPVVPFQLSDDTWVMPGIPVPDLGVWKEWIGSIRTERLSRTNLVLLVEEPSHNPEILDAVHQRLGGALTLLFNMLHLRTGVQIAEGADLLCGSSENGVPRIRRMSQLVEFYQNKGFRRAPITRAWLEEALALRPGVVAVEADNTQFRRFKHGLNVLFKGLRETTGQDRIHQFVRSLEALILPDIGRTKRDFAHRCQTFVRPGNDTHSLLCEVFDMRSNAEHLNLWDKAVHKYPVNQRDDVCWQRTRQIERLACDAYSRVLRNPGLRNHFRTEDTITAFWKLPDKQRHTLWGPPLDIAQEPLTT